MSLELVLTLALGFVNQVVVGHLGATAIAAVGLATSVVLILVLTLRALGTSVGILVARAWGAADHAELHRVVRIGAGLAFGLAWAVCLPLLAWAQPLLRCAGASAAVAVAGGSYLAIAALSVPFTTLSAVLSATMRSTGRPRRPLVATAVTVALEAALAAALVLGLGPAPTLGVPGAAVALVAAATVKTGVLLLQLRGAAPAPPPVGQGRHTAEAPGGRVLSQLSTLAAPLALTALLWSAGTFLYNIVAARLGDDALAGAQIAVTLEGVFFVGSFGLASAANALVGRAIEASDPERAQQWVRAVIRTGAVTGLMFGGLFLLSTLLVPALYAGVGDRARHVATVGILVNGVFQVVKVRNFILGAGVLPTAGDARGVLVGDTVGAFVVGLPLAVVLGLLTPLGMVGVFGARIAEELAKVGVFSRRLGRLRWTELARPA